MTELPNSPAHPRPLAVSAPIKVQGYDIDFAGIVSNIVYIRWLEDLRYLVLETYLPLAGLLAEGVAPVLARTEIDYRRPIKHFDRVEGQMWLAELNGPRWVLAAEIHANGKRAAQARQTGVFASTASQMAWSGAVPKLIGVAAGRYRMGSPFGGAAEQPTHPVALSAFALGASRRNSRQRQARRSGPPDRRVRLHHDAAAGPHASSAPGDVGGGASSEPNYPTRTGGGAGVTAPLPPDPVTAANLRLSAVGVAVPKLVGVAAGRYRMGSPFGGAAEQPTHPVALSAFALGETPVTNAQYAAFIGATQYRPAQEPPAADDYPMVGVSYADARAYLAWLAEVSRLPLDLPSEAQWEYACRAGSVGDFGLPAHSATDIDTYAWTAANSHGRLQQVRQKRPNSWGFYDLHGLVWEWTRDFFAPYLPYPEPLLDPVTSADTGRGRVVRGGSWQKPPEYARAGYRAPGQADSAHAPDLGFRVALRL